MRNPSYFDFVRTERTSKTDIWLGSQSLQCPRSAPYLLASAFAIAFLAPAASFAQAADILASDSQSDDGRLGEILVTARRQPESAQSVPISLTSVSGAAFRDGQFSHIEDLNQFSPSLNIVMPTPGNSSLSIRGVGANPGSLGLSTSVATFIDGVYMGKQGMSAIDLIDLQQVDVLRGPQGTLFGKNTSAGAIDIKTAQPSFTWTGVGQVSIGNLGYQQYQGALSGPISDTLAFRITGDRSLRDGFIDGTTLDRKLSNLDRWGVRGQLLFKPSSDFSIRLIGDYNHENDSAITPLLTSLGAAQTSYLAKLKAIDATVIAGPDGDATASDVPAQLRSTNKGVSAEINWNLGKGMALTSISAWREWNYFTFGDADLTNRDVASLGTAFLRNRQLTQEVRLASARDKPISFVVGAFYYNSDATQDSRTNYGADAAAYLTGIPNASLPAVAAASPAVALLAARNNTAWDVWAKPEINSYALFGQAVWRVTPKLNLTAGLRESYERETMLIRQPNPVSLTTGQPVAALAVYAYPETHVSVDDWSTSWLASADYALASTARVYAQVSHGVKAGGTNSALPSALGPKSLIVKPETSTNYEIGIKSRFADDHIQLNVSVFNMDISDYQAIYQAVLPDGVSTAAYITNVGKVRTRGVEVEASAVPVRGLRLGINGSYNDAKYRSYVNGPCPVEVTGKLSCDLSGKTVPQAPKWIVNASASYRTDLGRGVTGLVGGNYAYRSSRYGYGDISEYAKIGAAGLLSANMGIELAGGRYQISVWGKNLTNVRQPASYLSFGPLIPSNYAAFFNEPRTYGVRGRASF
jgi:iron complex outermembrane receptor protein